MRAARAAAPDMGLGEAYRADVRRGQRGRRAGRRRSRRRSSRAEVGPRQPDRDARLVQDSQHRVPPAADPGPPGRYTATATRTRSMAAVSGRLGVDGRGVGALAGGGARLHAARAYPPRPRSARARLRNPGRCDDPGRGDRRAGCPRATGVVARGDGSTRLGPRDGLPGARLFGRADGALAQRLAGRVERPRVRRARPWHAGVAAFWPHSGRRRIGDARPARTGPPGVAARPATS